MLLDPPLRALSSASDNRDSMIGIYVHIPYCRTLCPYCDFVKQRKRSVPDAFVDAVVGEIASYTGPRKAGSVFLGGGTPSLMSPRQMERLLEALDGAFDLEEPEVTIEVNPDDVTHELVRWWRSAGLNRVSLGVQSFDDATLRYLGRRHDAASALRACETIASEYENWNLDLIFGGRRKLRLSERDESSEDTARIVDAWEATLATALSIGPPHVASYGLTFEPGTPFEKRIDEALDDETSLHLYRMAEAALDDFDHYEVSNYARPGWQSRHNLIYWHNLEYAGFGPGGYSFIDGTRARNNPDVDAYLEAPGVKSELLDLSPAEVRVETLIQYFRLRDGLPKQAYRERFGEDIRTQFAPQLDTLLKRGLLEESVETLRPTAEGFYLNNEIGLVLVD